MKYNVEYVERPAYMDQYGREKSKPVPKEELIQMLNNELVLVINAVAINEIESKTKQ